MSSTDKVLGTIGALATLIDNFPMSILDLFKGKKYTSIFDFLMDVLIACGVPVNEAIEWLLKKIFAIEMHLDGGIDKINEALARGDYRSREESEFLRGLDVSIKGILMALLSSLYGCSSIPVIPNKVMDYPDPNIFSGATKDNKNEQNPITGSNKMWEALWHHQIYPARFDIPAKMIDPMGMLGITPTSSEGRLFYDIDGNDVYYRKKETSNPGNINAIDTIEDIKLYFIKTSENNDTYLQITTDECIFEDINITIEYVDTNGNNLSIWNTVLKTYNNLSDKLLIKRGEDIKIGKILKIKINGEYNKYSFNLIVGEAHCYFSYEKSENCIKDFQHYNIFENVMWAEHEHNNENILGTSIANIEEEMDDSLETPSIDDSDFEEIETPVYYVYEMLSEKPKDFKKAKRMASTPTTANENSPELVVVYVGTNPNDLYKTYDMNAFIWYTLNRSTRAAQIDINHTMWDSRLKYYRGTKKDLNEDELNKWYNSKKTNKDEFLNVFKIGDDGKNTRITKNDNLYPILQLKKTPNNLYGLTISFPSQKYYKPNFRNRFIQKNGEVTGKIFSFNSTIYKFNWDYLESIQILKPRLLLANFINYLVGGIMNEVTNAEFNITKEIIKNKVSTATKKIIEADDGEIEDCYSTFSNDEFDVMLEDMLLSRYDMTYYGGNETKVKKHDVDSYIASLDSVNASTSREESVTKMVKLVEDVSVAPGSEGSVNFGFESSIDKSIINKLIWSLVMPIIDSLFTPQVMLLIIINMSLSGAVKLNEFGKDDFGALLNLILNKIMGLIKSIIKFIIEKIAEMLFQFILAKIMPLIIKWMAALKIEELRNWLNILIAAINCIPQLDIKFNVTKLGGIDDVNYADIIDTGSTSTPEATSSC